MPDGVWRLGWRVARLPGSQRAACSSLALSRVGGGSGESGRTRGAARAGGARRRVVGVPRLRGELLPLRQVLRVARGGHRLPRGLWIGNLALLFAPSSSPNSNAIGSCKPGCRPRRRSSSRRAMPLPAGRLQRSWRTTKRSVERFGRVPPESGHERRRTATRAATRARRSYLVVGRKARRRCLRGVRREDPRGACRLGSRDERRRCRNHSERSERDRSGRRAARPGRAERRGVRPASPTGPSTSGRIVTAPDLLDDPDRRRRWRRRMVARGAVTTAAGIGLAVGLTTGEVVLSVVSGAVFGVAAGALGSALVLRTARNRATGRAPSPNSEPPEEPGHPERRS